jgi:hypothetical protein
LARARATARKSRDRRLKNIFVRDAFDIAPLTPRHTSASWLVLIVGSAVFLFCAWSLADSVNALDRANTASKDLVSAAQALAKSKRAASKLQSDPKAAAITKAQRALEKLSRISWSDLFEALELAAYEVDDGVSIISLVPSNTQGDAALVNITALAVSPKMMLTYVQALQEDAHVRQVEITSHQPEAKVGPTAIRFQATVLWIPELLDEAIPDKRQANKGLAKSTETEALNTLQKALK